MDNNIKENVKRSNAIENEEVRHAKTVWLSQEGRVV